MIIYLIAMSFLFATLIGDDVSNNSNQGVGADKGDAKNVQGHVEAMPKTSAKDTLVDDKRTDRETGSDLNKRKNIESKSPNTDISRASDAHELGKNNLNSITTVSELDQASRKDRKFDNPLSPSMRVASSFASDQSIINASMNVNMFVRMHNRFFTRDITPFDPLNESSFDSRFGMLRKAFGTAFAFIKTGFGE